MEELEQQEKDKSTEDIFNSIMTAEEYSKIEHSIPYIFELKSGDKELYYFGSQHTYDASSPMYTEIEYAFNKVNPDIVFVEGMDVRGDLVKFNERIKSDTREEVIRFFGEPGFTIKLGVEKGIEWKSPEPSHEDLYNDLLANGFSKDEIFVWIVFRILPQYTRQMKKDGFEKSVSGFIDRFKQSTNWEGFDYSYIRAIKLGEQILGRSVDVENEQDASDFIDPIPWGDKEEKQTIINRVNEQSSVFRDRKIVRDIIEALKTHKRVFVVYGASHASMQEPAFKKAFESVLSN